MEEEEENQEKQENLIIKKVNQENLIIKKEKQENPRNQEKTENKFKFSYLVTVAL